MRDPLDTDTVVIFNIRPVTPTMHLRRRTWVTDCGLDLFVGRRSVTALLQYRHARLFARTCERCLAAVD